MVESVPVILCGKTEQIGGTVIETLKPEYEAVHFILTPADGVAKIPLLLKGEKTVPSVSALGSKNYSQPPAAVLIGAGYDDVAVAEMMEAAATAGTKPVPWLRPDMTKPAPPLGPEYGKAMVQRIKETLKELAEKGGMDEAKVVLY